MKEILNKLIEHQWLSREESRRVLIEMASGTFNTSQIAAFLTVYMMRSVTIEELEPDQAAIGAAPGDITLAEVSMTLQPVGPGGAVTVACTPVLIDAADNYDDVLQATLSLIHI